MQCPLAGDVHPESGSLLHSSNLINVLPKHIAIFYLLNPFLILNCAARTTVVWNNFFLAAALLALTQGIALQLFGVIYKWNRRSRIVKLLLGFPLNNSFPLCFIWKHSHKHTYTETIS